MPCFIQTSWGFDLNDPAVCYIFLIDFMSLQKKYYAASGELEPLGKED